MEMRVSVIVGILVFNCAVFVSYSRNCVPVHCQKGHWGEWSECSASCGTDGIQSRERPIFKEAQCSGKCGRVNDEQPCNQKCCPEDCEYGQWSMWGECYCAETCEEAGRRDVCHRSREKKVTETCGGYCDNKLTEQQCNDLCCKQDCVTGEWEAWGECNARCEQKGSQTRTKKIVQEAKCGGRECDLNQQSQACEEGCCPVDCVLGEWSEWTNCTDECYDRSNRYQHRRISFSECGGLNCTQTDRFLEKRCEPFELNVDCQVKVPFLFLMRIPNSCHECNVKGHTVTIAYIRGFCIFSASHSKCVHTYFQIPTNTLRVWYNCVSVYSH